MHSVPAVAVAVIDAGRRRPAPHSTTTALGPPSRWPRTPGRRGDVRPHFWRTHHGTSMKDPLCADPAYPTNCDPARASFTTTSGVGHPHPDMGMFGHCSSLRHWWLGGLWWLGGRQSHNGHMFRSAVAFDQDLSGYVDSLTACGMSPAPRPSTRSGWCVADDSDLQMRSKIPCARLRRAP